MLRKQNLIKNLFFSGVTVLIFFILVEGTFLLTGIQPKFIYRSFELPFWLSNLDPLVVENYKKRLDTQGMINEDIYAYQFDSDLEWMLKPGIEITVKNYSSAIFVDKMPKWTIASNLMGFRKEGQEKKDDTEFSNTIYILGDSSSFGWGIEFDETYGAALQKRLNRGETKKYALVNYSIPGFSSFQGRLLMDRIQEFHAGDLVLVSFGANDASASIDSDHERFEKRHSFHGRINSGMNKLISYRLIKSFLTRKKYRDLAMTYSGSDKSDITFYNQIIGGYEKRPAADVQGIEFETHQGQGASLQFRTGNGHTADRANQYLQNGEAGIEKKGKKRVSLKDYEGNLRYIFQLVHQKKGHPIFINVCNRGKYFKTAKKVSKALKIPFFDFPRQMLPYLNNIIVGEIKPEKYQDYLQSYGLLIKKDSWLIVLFPDRCHPNVIGHHLMGKIISNGIRKL